MNLKKITKQSTIFNFLRHNTNNMNEKTPHIYHDAIVCHLPFHETEQTAGNYAVQYNNTYKVNT